MWPYIFLLTINSLHPDMLYVRSRAYLSMGLNISYPDRIKVR